MPEPPAFQGPPYACEGSGSSAGFRCAMSSAWKLWTHVGALAEMGELLRGLPAGLLWGAPGTRRGLVGMRGGGSPVRDLEPWRGGPEVEGRGGSEEGSAGSEEGPAPEEGGG